jgi:hypothetical protein
MNLYSTIIGVALIVLCILPLAWTHRKKKEKQRKIKEELIAHALSNSCNITRFDSWHNTMIGIDDEKGGLFFLREGKNGSILKQVHLAGISESHTNGTDNPAQAPSLELVLVHKSLKEPDTVLEFFNNSGMMQLNNELELLKKWHSIVKERINR